MATRKRDTNKRSAPRRSIARRLKALKSSRGSFPDIPDLSVNPASASELMSVLNARATTIAARLILENPSHVASASDISKRFGIAVSTLHHWKRTGRAIAFRPEGAREDLFPISQLNNGKVAPWAREGIAELGNGLPAFLFLMVPRRSLGGVSISHAILSGSDDAPAKIAKYLARLVIE